MKRLFASSLAAALAASLLPGCNPVFMTQEMYTDAHAYLMPAKYEEDHCGILGPISDMTKAPATVLDPDREPRHLTLQEAFAIALENGHVSSRAGAGRGLADDTLGSLGQGGASMNAQTERVRALAMGPAVAHAAMEAALARFDVLSYMNMAWANTDNLQQGLASFQNGHSATFTGGFIKPTATGGLANMSMIVSYQNLNTPPTGVFGILNPQYTTRLVIGYEQPLWKDWGVEMNQLLARFPSITALSFNQGLNAATAAFNARQGNISGFVNQNTEGILISRLRFDQQRAEFERNMHILIAQTEVAYWTLYSKYGQLYSIEENLRIMHKTWQENYDRFKAGSLPPQSYYQILGQYEEFRSERVRALNEVLDAERHLRGILGLKVEDGTKLIPITPPTLAELRPDWEQSLQAALIQRPELQLARDNLKYHQYLLSIQKNFLKPDLRGFFRMEPVGFGNTLTGNGTFLDGTGAVRPTNAFESLTKGSFNDWTFGVNMNMPLGWRFELAAVRSARLQLTQSYVFLRDQEDKAARFLGDQYQQLAHWQERIKAHRAERLAYRESLQKRLDQIKAGSLNFGGNEKEGPLAFLDAQRRYAAALIKEFNAIAEYNSTLARYEWARGSILRYNNIHIAEGALPKAAQVSAVEYEKERSRSLVLRDRPDSLDQPGQLCATKESDIPSLSTFKLIDGDMVPPPGYGGVAPPAGKPSLLDEVKKDMRGPMSPNLPNIKAQPRSEAAVTPVRYESANPALEHREPLPALPSPAPMPGAGVTMPPPEGDEPPLLPGIAQPPIVPPAP